MSRYREPSQQTYITMDTVVSVVIRLLQVWLTKHERWHLVFLFPSKTGATGCRRKCKTIATSFVFVRCRRRQGTSLELADERSECLCWNGQLRHQAVAVLRGHMTCFIQTLAFFAEVHSRLPPSFPSINHSMHHCRVEFPRQIHRRDL